MGDSSAVVDHDARSRANRAFDLAQQCIKNIESHEARCLRVNEAIWDELKTQRLNSTANHASVLEAIQAIHRDYDKTITAVQDVQISQNEKIAHQTHVAEQRATAFYKWILSGVVGVIVSMGLIVVSVWIKP